MSATLVCETAKLNDVAMSVEDAIVEVLANYELPLFLSPGGFVSPHWRVAVHQAIITYRPELGYDFILWCSDANKAALETNRPPRLPLPTAALRYPMLSWGPNGQVDVLREDDPVYPR